MELKKITDKVYYIPNSTNIGVIRNEGKSVILIDSGLDDDTGRKILKLLEENDMFPDTIINTHSHADHCGGNRYIKDRTSIITYAPEVESSIIEQTLLEPLSFFSNANPPKDLRNKFLMARPSKVDYVIKDEKVLSFGEIDINIIPLNGHSPNQIGIEADGVLFCADSLFSGQILEKHKIPFFTDIDKTRKTLEFLRNSSYKFYVPSHAEPTDSIIGLVNRNLEAIESTESHISKSKGTAEKILKDTCNHYQIEIKNMQQYYLMNTVIMSYLSSLYNRGKMSIELNGNSLVWK